MKKSITFEVPDCLIEKIEADPNWSKGLEKMCNAMMRIVAQKQEDREATA